MLYHNILPAVRQSQISHTAGRSYYPILPHILGTLQESRYICTETTKLLYMNRLICSCFLAHYAMLFSSILNCHISLSANMGTIIITEQPKSQVDSFGSSVSLTCKATLSDGSPNDLNYMWYLNRLSLLEHTTPEYRIASFTEEDEGMYSCEVSTLNQSVMSQMASLSVAK